MTHVSRLPAAVPVNGATLREMRVRSGLKMSDLAREAGMTRNYINKIEVGERCVSPAVYQSLMRALGVRDFRALLRMPVGDISSDGRPLEGAAA